MQPLSSEDRQQLASRLPAWAFVEGRDAIVRHLRFKTFSETWGFMSRVALLAEQQDHHPEWSNVYNRLTITLTTHDADGLSDLDVRMATAIDQLAPTV